MILLVHMIFGAAMGSLAQNIYLGALFALLSHYFLDTLPHIEYLESTERSIINIKHRSGDAIKVFLDFMAGIFLIYIFSDSNWLLYCYALITIIPDGLTVITHLFPNKILLAHHWIHSEPIHYLTKQKHFPVFWKVFSQIITMLVACFLLASAL